MKEYKTKVEVTLMQFDPEHPGEEETVGQPHTIELQGDFRDDLIDLIGRWFKCFLKKILGLGCE